MRFYKLRVTPNANDIASTFNKQFQPEIIAEYNDPYRVEWTENVSSEDAYAGDEVCLITSFILCEFSGLCLRLFGLRIPNGQAIP
jgi:hypothetical protein